jgi:MFS family permease
VVLPAFLVASLAVEIRGDFPLSDSVLGLAVGISYAVAALTSMAAGRAVDRLGPAHSVLAGGVLAAASSLGIALFTHSPAVLTGLLCLAGAANALAGPGTSALISQTMAPGHQGRAIGVQQAGVPTGALIAGLALPIVAVPFGWRWAFVVAAVLPVAVVVVATRLRLSAHRTERLRARVRGGRRLRDVHLMAVAAALATAASTGMLTFLVVFSVGADLAPRLAGFLLAATSLASVVTRIWLGGLADRRPIGLPHIAGAMAVGSLGLLLLATNQVPGIVLGAILAGGIGYGWSGLLILVLIRAYPATPGETLGIMMAGLFTGAAAGPLITGLLAENTTFPITWICAAAMGGAAAVSLLAAERLGDERAVLPTVTDRRMEGT